MNRLQELNAKLMNDPFYTAVELYDADKKAFIGKNMQLSDFAPQNSLIEYLTVLYNTRGVKKIQILEKRKNGSVFKNMKNAFIVNLDTSREENISKAQNSTTTTITTEATPVEQTNIPPEVSYTPPVPPAPMYPPQAGMLNFFGGNGLHGANAAIDEIAELKATRRKLDNAEDELRKFKNEYDDARRDIRKLEIENTDLRVKLGTANMEKDLAIKLTSLENRNFGDTELGKKLPEMLTGIAEAYITKQASGQNGLNAAANANLNDERKALIEMAQNEEIPDALFNEILYMMQNMLVNAQYLSELRAINNKYQTPKTH